MRRQLMISAACVLILSACTSLPPSTTPQPQDPSTPTPTSSSTTSATPTTSTISPTTSVPTALDMTGAQRRLLELGFWMPAADGKYGPLTQQALWAFQKSLGLERTGELDNPTTAALSSAERPKPRSTSGDLVEIDKARQLVLIVRDGNVLYALTTSTGTEKPYYVDGRKALADTPAGRFRVTYQVNGYHKGPVGSLYRPKYFHPDGIAVHGAPQIPPHPASHGCARVSNPAADLIWAEDLMPLGSEVWVY